jgi:hypothetical protein
LTDIQKEKEKDRMLLKEPPTQRERAIAPLPKKKKQKRQQRPLPQSRGKVSAASERTIPGPTGYLRRNVVKINSPKESIRLF